VLVIIDVHAHYVSPRVVEAVRAEPETFGIGVVESEAGPQFVFAGKAPIRAATPPLRDLTQRRERMHTQGLDLQVLSTWFELYAYHLPPEQGARWSRLVNQTTAEDIRALEHHGAFLALANVPLQDGARAADELEYAVTELGMRGAMIAPNILDRLLDDADLDPFWRKAEQLGALLMMHPFAPSLGFRTAQYYLDNVLANPFDTTIGACTLVFGGIADRFPDLRVLLVHGGGFFPYQIGRVNQGYAVVEANRAHASRAPLDYLRWFQYDTMLLHPPAIRYLADTVGTNEIVLGSDFPFPMSDGDPAESVRQAGLSPDELRAVFEGNPRRLLRL
jgi:aminocarboxymuconate-semialdehyde decarboxylase